MLAQLEGFRRAPLFAERTHRLENPGKFLLELVEVQTGSYLGKRVRLMDGGSWRAWPKLKIHHLS